MNLNSLSASSARAAATETQPLSLKEGQMIHGKITHLFPGQMAQVQIGNQQLYAKLEVPMQAGDNYYFKVNGTEPELQLQVISGPVRGGEGQSAQLTQLMESLNLPKTKEMKDVLATIIKQRIPMTLDNMLEAVNLLKTLPEGMKAEALATLGKIAEARLPFTPAIFQSLLQAQTGTIAQQFTTLLAAIQSEPNLPPAMREQLMVTMQALSSPLSQVVGKELFNQSVSQLLNPQASQADRLVALQLLKNADILPARTSLANLPQVLAEQITKVDTLPANVTSNMTHQTDASKAIQSLVSQLSQTPVANQQTIKAVVQNITQQLPNTTLPEPVKNALQTVINQITQQPMTDRAKATVVEQFSKVFTQVTATQATALSALPNTALVDQLNQIWVQQANRQETADLSLRQQTVMKEVQQSVSSLLVPHDKANEAIRVLMQTAEKSENSQVKQLIQTAEAQVSQTINGAVMKEAIKHVFSTLGVNYEAMLLGKEPDIANLASALKPQLLAMLQDPSLSPTLRDAAETMVLRMNGTLLQSGETGTQQQLIMQLPIEMFGKKIDATLQWNSRMKEDGKIDPAFARILFYLELESLSTTLVDMHVQNKVVNLTIFNDEPSLKTTGPIFQDVLKEGLEGVGYKLSGVMFKAITEKQQNSKKTAGTFQSDEGGVDYRI
ncbi:hypothetical protein CSV80_02125 [Sporosarcina sp. P12(2017)]|uniref:hypothetical protein n=1 Tax=unclassified Sporosarcina TaxID=2647733 RepID=UPI000C168FB5|nr:MULTISPECIES: hypothetical protein [unclassified Sporosarcina]PIC58808.1 hypothetical protein CSV81_02120 [Sporosarcina sp. P10]PIC62128.1 hypothetical protein CSV80_02125 [Sporosarcina sp. P12(2017)]